MRTTGRRRACALLLDSVLAGCGGSGAQGLPAPAGTPASAPPKTTARFTITVPAQSAQAHSRRSQYVSVNTQSVIITLATVNGTAFSGPQAETAVNLTPSSPSCSGVPLTCTITAPAAAGTDVFDVSTYNAQQSSSAPPTPSGSVLSTGTISTATFPSDPHISGTQTAGYAIVGSQPYTLTILAQDASGATIIGDGAPTFNVTSGSGAVTVAAAGANAFAVRVKSYSASPVSLTITPSTGTATNVALSIVEELWVASYTSNAVTAYSLSAPPTQIVSDTITAGVNQPSFLAFDANGDLWLSNNNGGVGSEVLAYVPGTNAVIAADTITIPSTDPLGLAFDASGNIWVAEYTSGKVTAYVPGTNTAIAADTITGLDFPAELAFDASGKLWESNSSGESIAAYVPGTNAPIAADTITASLSFPFGIAFDASGRLWVVNNGNNTVTAYQPGTNAAIAGDTITSGLDSPFFAAFDGNGNLWVSNQNNNTITAYVPGTRMPGRHRVRPHEKA